MKNLVQTIFFMVLLGLLLSTCAKRTGNYESASIGEFLNLEPGKYITYQLDSTVTLPFGTGFQVHSYQVKDVVDAAITDNLNRPGWRIIRYMRDNQDTSRWEPNNTYAIFPTRTSLEVVENNLRFRKLMLPLKDGYSWNGNVYVHTSPFYANSVFSQWQFTYKDIGKPFLSGGMELPNTVTVVQFDSSQNKPFYDKAYHMYSKGYEVYAKDVGLVYKDVMDREYQVFADTRNCIYVTCANNVCDTVSCDTSPDLCDALELEGKGTKSCADTIVGNAYFSGYGVRMRMIEHN